MSSFVPIHIIQISASGEDIYGIDKFGNLYYWGSGMTGGETSKKIYGWKLMVDDLNNR